MSQSAFITTLLLAGFLIGSNNLSQAQEKCVGRVIDAENGEPLTGVLVQSNTGQGTTTQSDGTFEIDLNQPLDSIQLTFSFLGYETLVRTIALNRKENPEFRMRINPASLQEVTVHGSPVNYNKEFKGSSFRMDPATLELINPLNTEEILRQIPGINIVGDMGLSNRPNISIRGSWGRRSKKVLLLEDGSPAAPAPYVAPGAYYNPVSDRVQSIEIYKGADLLKFGPNNMFGAVNYITNAPPLKPQTRVRLVGGQRNYRTGMFSYGGTWNQVGAMVEGVYKKFDGFVQNSSVEMLNLNTKVVADLTPSQSLSFKFSSQFEDNQASLSSITPYTFEQDPTQNPFDADRFLMKRFGLDLIHKWTRGSRWEVESKIYGSRFERDWWRQVTDLIPAGNAIAYLGEDIVRDRYGYLLSAQPESDDFIRVGRITNDRESITDSRWNFNVAGWKEKVIHRYPAWGQEHEFELGLKAHFETYSDRFLRADSSRWARSGQLQSERYYQLYSLSSYLRNEFQLGEWTATPIFRFEYVDMFRQNLLELAQDPDLESSEDGREKNNYQVLLPGLTVTRATDYGEFFASAYRGFIAPSKIFGFLVERNGIVSNPFAGESINIGPETSINTEIGWKGGLWKDRLEGQLTYFNNTISNYFAGGRNEVFRKRGTINIQGMEMGLHLRVIDYSDQGLDLRVNGSWIHSRILSGVVVDRDLFSQVVHSEATKNELIQRVNTNRDDYAVFKKGPDGELQEWTQEEFQLSDFEDMEELEMQLGRDGLSEIEMPYTPAFNLSTTLKYRWKQFKASVLVHHVSDQYGEFFNFQNESADGAVGALPGYTTVDVNFEYQVLQTPRHNLRLFINGKNVTNQIYRASRLNRASSGIFPGGFRQIIAGVDWRW